jgi:aldose 1-epimerase
MPVTEHSIRFGPYAAIITSRGGALRELRHDGRELVVGFGEAGAIPDYRGVICAPWPNRMADGRYHHDGQLFEAAINEADRQTALHGLVFARQWELLRHDSSSVRLGCRLESGTDYPGDLDISVDYDLRADGLHCRVLALNVGAVAAPYGVCPHPYLVAGEGALNDWTLEIPAAEFLAVTPDRLLPEEVWGVEGHAFDFRTERLIGDVEIDHAFTGILTDADGNAAVRIFDPSGTGVELEWDGRWPWLQIHTADKPAGPSRMGLAVEPMTCPPDAFNSGTDLVRIAPAGSHEAGWTIRAISR